MGAAAKRDILWLMSFRGLIFIEVLLCRRSWRAARFAVRVAIVVERYTRAMQAHGVDVAHFPLHVRKRWRDE